MIGQQGAIIAFLDANVLAKPFTRTLLWAGAPLSGYQVVWSVRAEQEATRHLPARATPVAALRIAHGLALSPTGVDPTSFTSTDDKDRQILADAVACGARFLVTENVADFGIDDLRRCGIAAVHHDLFLAHHLTRDGYATALQALSENMRNPARTPATVHAAVARQHPLLFATHADLYPVEPATTVDRPPSVAFRGRFCIRCGAPVADGVPQTGLGPECRPSA